MLKKFNLKGKIEIKWRQDKLGGTYIDLYKAGAFYYRIQGPCDEYKQITNNGYTKTIWDPHNSLPVGTDYQIKIHAPNDATISSISDGYFSITEPAVE